MRVILNPRDVQIATQENLFDMMALLETNYGGWNSNEGGRNYLESLQFRNFTTSALVLSGLLTVRKSEWSERAGMMLHSYTRRHSIKLGQSFV